MWGGVCVGVGVCECGCHFSCAMVHLFVFYATPVNGIPSVTLAFSSHNKLFRYLLVPAYNCDTKSVFVCSVSVHVLVLCVTKQRVEVFTVPTPHQVNGRPVTGLTRSEVVSLLRQAQGDVTLVVSRHEVVDEQDAEE